MHASVGAPHAWKWEAVGAAAENRPEITQPMSSVEDLVGRSSVEVRAEATVEAIPGGTRKSVPRDGLRIGRAPDCGIVLSGATISKHHVELLWQGDELYARDLGSCNGTRRDGVRLSKDILLGDGDELVLGGAAVLRLTIRNTRFGVPTSELLEDGGELSPAAIPSVVQPVMVDLLPIVTKLYQAASHEELGLQLTRAVAEALKASRVALLELEDGGQRFRVAGLYKQAKYDPTPLHDAYFVSRTVVRGAHERGTAYYMEGALASSESMIRSGAHSAAAVRMRPRDRRELVLYMDAIVGEPLLTASHARALELLAAHAVGAVETLSARLTRSHDRMHFEQLRRYFSPAVVEHILGAGEHVVAQPQQVDATVLFADLVGYTKLSERLRDQPDRLLTLLNRWLDCGADAVIQHEGTLDKFIGDCVMAVFGAPFQRPNSELSAVQCALDMVRGVEEIAVETGEDLQITVGINSGAMLAGSVGSQRRLEYTVLGDTVNVASRLQNAAGPGEILLGPECAARVAGAVELEDAGTLTLKNHGPVRAARLRRNARPM